MKEILALIGTIILVALCGDGIYKQVDDFNKKSSGETAYVEVVPNTVIF